ncbi:hypothetical protein D043_0520B, partial [Vibrio parahaemolyticus EKP-021]
KESVIDIVLPPNNKK